jgi:carbamoyl-phosphate synthase large subunit
VPERDSGKNDLNVLLLSCGTRNKIIQYFKRELAGRGLVIATDCSKLAPALYEADRHYIVPRIDSDDYLDVVLEICRENKIRAVLSLIDPELSILAKHRELFLENGILPVVSDYEVVELCLDKYEMARFLKEHGYLTARTYISKEEFYADVQAGVISYPVFVKPRKGSASIGTHRVTSEEELELLFRRFDDLIIQEFMDGAELGADVYVDMITGEPVSIFVKKKLKMRAGETDKSVSFKDDALFRLIVDFVKKVGLRGIIDMDIFQVGGDYYISEVNPRFGGGYPHAHECGVNAVAMILNNIQGVQNVEAIGEYEQNVYMMKYGEILIQGSF